MVAWLGAEGVRVTGASSALDDSKDVAGESSWGRPFGGPLHSPDLGSVGDTCQASQECR